jgi:hypothetical protein
VNSAAEKGRWIGETVLTQVGPDVVPALVIAVAAEGPALLCVVQTDNATFRTWLEPAPVSEIAELEEGFFVARSAAIWGDRR